MLEAGLSAGEATTLLAEAPSPREALRQVRALPHRAADG